MNATPTTGARYRDALPQLNRTPFLTDGGLETTLIFHDGHELPHFAAFDLMRTTDGKETLRRYYAHYAAIARDSELGFILEAPTWRARIVSVLTATSSYSSATSRARSSARRASPSRSAGSSASSDTESGTSTT